MVAGDGRSHHRAPIAAIVGLVVAAAGCVTRPPSETPVQPKRVDVAVAARDPQGRPIAGASCQDGESRVTTNQAGNASLGRWPEGQRLVACSAPEHAYTAVTYTVVWPQPQTVVVTLAPLHVDPSTIPLGELARIRGAMWPRATVCPGDLRLPLGPRPAERDNIIATTYFDNYTPTQQEAIARCFNALGWTHVVVGGLVDEWAYHGEYIGHDYGTPAAFERFLDQLQWFWDHGLKPIVFVREDGATYEETERLVRQLIAPNSRAQQLIRIVVMSGWEPARGEWSSCTWAKYVHLAHVALPNALNLIHTVSDVDAPAGNDALCSDDDESSDARNNAEAWERVIREGLHGWLIQNGPYRSGPADEPRLAREFAAQFKKDDEGAVFRSSAWHFAGHSSWPSFSAWGPTTPICLYAAEQSAFEAYWFNRPGDGERNAWGDLAVRSGACGYLDGGTIGVPVLR
jgi:hypothetical protein